MQSSVNLFGFLLLNGCELLHVENSNFMSVVFIAIQFYSIVLYIIWKNILQAFRIYQ